MGSVTTKPRVEAPPALVARVDGKTVALRVKGVRIDVRIAGLASRTTMILTFENPHDRVLEGEVRFPLPEGAAVCGFGLDVDGGLVDASLVARREARVIYEEEVRKGIDPGLLEHAAGNVFRTRVYPVPAGGRRTVKVEWTAPLSGGAGEAVYELPLRFAAPSRDASAHQERAAAAWSEFLGVGSGAAPAAEAGGFALRVEVARSDVHPEFGWPAEDLGFTDRGDAWVAETSRPETLPDRVRIVLPAFPARYALVEKGPGGEYYFRIEDLVEETPGGHGRALAPPGRVGILWDASLSRALAEKDAEFALLRALFRRWGTFEVRLFVLRDRREDAGRFRVLAGDGEEILETLRDLPHDGGTGGLSLPALDCDLHLLFSDGFVTFGGGEAEETGCPVFAFSSSPAADRAALRGRAEASGGAYFDLASIPPEEAASRVGGEPFSFLGLEGGDGEVAEVFPAARRPVGPGRCGVSGRLLSEEAEVTLLYGRGERVLVRRPYRLSRAGAGATGLAAALWAREKVERLSARPRRHAEELLDLGRRFHLVTPNASLLVLETLEQHLLHDVEPAPAREVLHRAWIEQRRRREEEEEGRKRAKLETVLEWWRELVSWWETEFPSSPPPGLGEVASPEATVGVEAPPEFPDAGEDGLMMMADLAAAAPPSGGTEGMAGAPLPLPGEGEGPGGAPGGGGIAVKPWDPDTPYLAALREAGEERAYAVYLALREEHGRSPAFYLDCATHFYGAGRPEIGRRILSNLPELGFSDPALLRICAMKLLTEGDLPAAAEILETVLEHRPEEPQSHRDLALVLGEMGEFRRAAELLWDVVLGSWDDRFPRIETIALVELNHLLAKASARGRPVPAGELGIDERFRALLDVDLRVVLSWDADLTDVDLWVIEPTGEKCFYSNRRTAVGGLLSEDFTRGYGPEVYMVRRAPPGRYEIKAHYYGSAQQSLLGPATILATIYTDYGRPEEECRRVTVRVAEVKDALDIAEVWRESPREPDGGE